MKGMEQRGELMPTMRQGTVKNRFGIFAGRRKYRREDVEEIKQQWEKAAQDPQPGDFQASGEEPQAVREG